MKKTSRSPAAIKPGGVEEYIKRCPDTARSGLKAIREAIRTVAPDAIETLSYFNMPGYSYEGYDYNGMFAWFSYKAPFARLHVRPEALVRYKKELSGYATTRAIVNFSVSKPIPKTLVKNLVKASLKAMKNAKSGKPLV